MYRIIFVLLLLVSVAGSQGEPSPWVTFAPEEAGFSVLFAGKPVETIDKKPSFTLHSFSLTLGRATFIASYTDYEPGKLDPNGTDCQPRQIQQASPGNTDLEP